MISAFFIPKKMVFKSKIDWFFKGFILLFFGIGIVGANFLMKSNENSKDIVFFQVFFIGLAIFFYILKQKNDCVLISNDLYRDKINYIRLFNFDISIRVFDINMKTKIVEKSYMKIQLSSLSKVINRNMIDQKYIRCTIPKRKLGCIL